MRGYGASLVVVISGAALLLFGILASTDAATVGGVTIGAMTIGAGAMLAGETRSARRNPSRDSVDGRTIDRLHRQRDRSREVSAPRGLSTEEWLAGDPDRPEDPYR